jgi:thymidine phosphorylase
VPPRRAGLVGAIDTRAVGLAIIALGGGRTRADASIDHRVGLTEIAGLGEPVDRDHPLCLCHARDPADTARIVATLQEAFTIVDAPPPPAPIVAARL